MRERFLVAPESRKNSFCLGWSRGAVTFTVMIILPLDSSGEKVLQLQSEKSSMHQGKGDLPCSLVRTWRGNPPGSPELSMSM